MVTKLTTSALLAFKLAEQLCKGTPLLEGQQGNSPIGAGDSCRESHINQP